MNHAAPLILSIAFIGAMAGTGQPQGHVPPPGHPGVHAPDQKVEQEPPPEAKPEDVKSIDSIINAMYSAMSADAGQPRDWDRLRSLFLPQARLIAVRPNQDGSAGAWFFSADDFIAFNRKYFEKGGYNEKEIARRQEAFASMAHVWSTYEARRSSKDADPYSRGIYSIQLLNDGSRWWIVNAYWDHERPDVPIPAAYLGNPKE